MDILIRKSENKIVPIAGARRLDAQLNLSGEVEVTVVATFEKITVVRDEYGDIVEKNAKKITE